MPCVRVHLIDPSGDVLPYDHALAAALARQGVDVELVTSRFVHGPTPEPAGYDVTESFYRLATRFGEHAPRRAARGEAGRARAGHAALPAARRRRPTCATSSGSRSSGSTRTCCRRARPRVLTMHNVIRREAVDLRLARADGRRDRAHPPRRRAARRRRARARDPARRVRAPDAPAARGAAARRARGGRAAGGPVLRRDPPVQGRGRAGRGVPAGRGRRAVGGRAAARGVDGAPAPARASGPRAVRGPLRERPGAARPSSAARTCSCCRTAASTCPACCSPGSRSARRWCCPASAASARSPRSTAWACSCRRSDPDALAAAIARLLSDDAERRRLEERARAAAAGPFSWDRIAERTASLYEQVRS